MMGVTTGEGMATLSGNQVMLQGYNITVGPVTGQFTLSGNMMSGVVTGGGMMAPVNLIRS